jgi:hypothetical protein
VAVIEHPVTLTHVDIVVQDTELPGSSVGVGQSVVISQEFTVLAEQVELELSVGVACVDCGAPSSAALAEATSPITAANVVPSAVADSDPGKATALLAACDATRSCSTRADNATNRGPAAVTVNATSTALMVLANWGRIHVYLTRRPRKSFKGGATLPKSAVFTASNATAARLADGARSNAAMAALAEEMSAAIIATTAVLVGTVEAELMVTDV